MLHLVMQKSITIQESPIDGDYRCSRYVNPRMKFQQNLLLNLNLSTNTFKLIDKGRNFLKDVLFFC